MGKDTYVVAVKPGTADGAALQNTVEVADWRKDRKALSIDEFLGNFIKTNNTGKNQSIAQAIQTEQVRGTQGYTITVNGESVKPNKKMSGNLFVDEHADGIDYKFLEVVVASAGNGGYRSGSEPTDAYRT